MPAIIRSAGAAGWSTIAVGQSIGAIAAVVVMFGWSIVGPSAVANASDSAAEREYVVSLVVRLALFVPALGAAAALTWALTGGDGLLIAVSVASTTLLGMRAGWFFIGRGTPWRLLVYEALPRAVGVWVGVALLVFLGVDTWIAIACQCVGLLAAVGASSLRAAPSTAASLRLMLDVARNVDLRHTLKEGWHGASASSVSTLFGSSPLMIMSVIAPTALPEFALVYRFQSQLMTAASPVLDHLQGWIPRGSREGLHRRAWSAQVIGAAGAVIAAAVILVAGASIYAFLGGGVIDPSGTVTAASALAIAIALLAQVSGITTLPALGGARYLAANVMIGSVFGVLAVAVLAYTWGSVGALIGLAAGLAVTTLLNLTAIATLAKRVAS